MPKLIKIVVDTSVLVVACMSRRANYSIDLLSLAFQGKIELIACRESLQEIKTVFSRPKFQGLLDTPDSVDLIQKYVNTVKIVKLEIEFLEKVNGFCPDPKDDVFLALADQTKANYLATLDTKDLLNLHTWQKVKIVRPVEICNLYEFELVSNF